MDIAEVRKQVIGAIARAKRGAADRRSRIDAATLEYERLLERTVVPLARQVASVLKAETYTFDVFTPAGSVRLMSERTADDYIEVTLDTAGEEPAVVGRTSRRRGHRVLQTEEHLGDPAALGEEEVLAFLLKSLQPLVER